jgi:hypothetical protein
MSLKLTRVPKFEMPPFGTDKRQIQIRNGNAEWKAIDFSLTVGKERDKEVAVLWTRIEASLSLNYRDPPQFNYYRFGVQHGLPELIPLELFVSISDINGQT